MTQLPETMPAAVFMGLRDVAVEDRPTPQPGPGELLLEVSHCGICGSDLHFLLEWGGRAGVIEGHEYSGTVAALGPDVAGWAVGERAIGGPSPRCGRCEYCLAHRTSLCVERGGVGGDDGTWQGAFARYKTVRAAEALRVPEGLSLKHAALTEPLAVALHGITRAGGARPGTRWLVTGGGPIGFLSVAALKALGVDDIVVSEPKASRRALCEKLGARAVDPTELVAPAMPYDLVDEPFDVALECSGNGRAQESALAQLKRAGTLVLVGAGMARPKFDPNRILLNELVITGAFVYDHDGFPRALELLASGRLANDLLVEQEDYPLNRLLDAAVGLHEGDLAAKAMIVPRTS
ncbi:MAG: alcohol dehydrogenase catalytic domain-containing protein [Actinomycetota bacterium]|nr:alcohol dehydrogenase catalytic domain-containing protein [Actinomycetota bacterium]